MTTEPGPVRETFAFACGNCGHGWEATFRLMFFTDPLDTTGRTTQEYVDEDGAAVRSPLTDAVCGKCGSRRVRVSAP
jgi:DNA-directed RNA polymerase subunit M/transcription elongation factor TFIIS